MPSSIMNGLKQEIEKSDCIMSKLINPPELECICYSLSKDKENNEKKIQAFDKAITLTKTLLSKVNDKEQLQKLNDKIKDCDKEKKNLSKVITEIEIVQETIENCKLFFVFLGKFYKLTIERVNFESPEQSLSLNLKLVDSLKFEEAELYKILVASNYFSIASTRLSFDGYQLFLENYTSKFYENISNPSDTYKSSLSILRALVNEFSSFFNCVKADNFSLKKLENYLATNIPTSESLPLPKSGHRLVGLWIFFSYKILLKYLDLKPVNSNFQYLRKSIKLEYEITKFNSPMKKNFISALKDLQQSFDKLEVKFNAFLLKKSNKSNENKEDYIIKEETKDALIFYQTLENSISDLDKLIKNLNAKYKSSLKMRELLSLTMSEGKLSNLLDLYNEKIGFNFYLAEKLNPSENISHIETSKDSLNYFYHVIGKDRNSYLYNEKIHAFINTFEDELNSKTSVSNSQYEINDLIDFGYFYFFTLNFPIFNERLSSFKDKLLLSKIFTLNVFSVRNYKIIIHDLKDPLREKIKYFFSDESSRTSSYFSELKKKLLDEVECTLQLIRDTIQAIKEAKILESNFSSKMPPVSSGPEENNLIQSLHDLETEEIYFKLNRETIKKYELSKSDAKLIKKKKKEKCKQLNNLIKNKNQNLNLYNSLSVLLKNLTLCIDCIENLGEMGKDGLLMRQFFSAKGQLSSEIIKLNASVDFHLINNEMGPAGLTFKVIREKIKEFININQKDEKEENELIVESQRTIKEISLKFHSIINSMADRYLCCNENAEFSLQNLSSLVVQADNKCAFFAKSARKKIYEKFPKDYFKLNEQYKYLKKLISAMRYDEDEQVIRLTNLVMKGKDHQKKFTQLKEKINLIRKPYIKRVANKPKIIDHSLVRQEIDTTSIEGSNNIQQIAGAEENSNNFVLSAIVSEDKAEVGHISNFTEIYRTIKPKIVKKVKSEYHSVNATLEEFKNWNEKFEKWKFEKNSPLFALFFAIENCSVIDLNFTKNAFLKCLDLYEAELTKKRLEINFFQKNLSDFFNRSNANKPNYLSNIQWLDLSLARIAACRELIFQNTNKDVTDYSVSLQSEAGNLANLHGLLALYVKSAIKYNNLKKEYMNEKYNKDSSHRIFISSIFKKNSLEEIEKEGKISKFSEKIAKVNQLKISIQHEYENKHAIIEKLKLNTNYEFLKNFINRIDSEDAKTLDVSVNNQPRIDQQQVSCVIALPCFY